MASTLDQFSTVALPIVGASLPWPPNSVIGAI